MNGLRGGPPEPSELRAELRTLIRSLDELEHELAAHEGNRPFVDPRPLSAIVDDIELVASGLKGWVERARKEQA